MRSMTKKLLLLMALFLGLAITLAPTAAFAAAEQTVLAQGGDDWDSEEGEEEDAFGNIMQMSFSTIDEVTFSAPAAGAACAVTAKITLTDEDEEATIKTVKLLYSVNGGAEASVDMAEADGAWTASIPGQAAGAKVDFYVQVVDSNGNMTTGAISSDKTTVAGIPDANNSEDIVATDADIMNIGANYDDNYIYFSFDVEGTVNGGTVDPPYIQLYGVKVTNPDIDEGEGLMVGKLWIYLPLVKDKTVQEKFMPLLLESGKEFIEKIGMDKIDRVKETGMLVLSIQKLMGGQIMEGLIFDAEPSATIDGGKFIGKIKRAPLGDNPSGYLRFIVLTAANASLDSFMPIPLNCSNFMQLYTKSYGYTVQ